MRKAAGWAAIYVAAALLVAMPYFLVVVDYPSATTVADKVALVVKNYASMYAMYLATYVAFGAAVGVVALALYRLLNSKAPFGALLATGVGLMWSVMLVASGMIFTYGMTTLVALAETNPGQAQQSWQAIEPVALALGGAGGELLGGLWVLLASVLVLREGAFSRPLGWLGMVIGVVGIASVVPPLHDGAMLFGVLQIVWFAWLGVALLRPRGATYSEQTQPAEPTYGWQA
jgi:hypothetical protein